MKYENHMRLDQIRIQFRLDELNIDFIGIRSDVFTPLVFLLNGIHQRVTK